MHSLIYRICRHAIRHKAKIPLLFAQFIFKKDIFEQQIEQHFAMAKYGFWQNGNESTAYHDLWQQFLYDNELYLRNQYFYVEPIL